MKKTAKKQTYRKTTMPVVFLRTDYSGGGCECAFYRSNGKKNRAYKIYDKLFSAKNAYVRQRQASERGLGPLVFGELFVAVDWRYNNLLGFGYETQIAKKFVSTNSNRDKMFRIANQLKMIDCHELNFGLINRKVVCIDFGDVSFGEVT